MTKNMVRRRTDGAFTSISNVALQDPRLSIEAVGALVCILSLPPDWKFNRSWAKRRFGVGKDKLDRVLKELSQYGYMQIKRHRGENGQYGQCVYVFSAEPDVPITIEPLPMPYSDYLKSDHWQALRSVKLKEADSRCQVCNAGGLLDVHHRTYERLGKESLEDLTVLCRECHDLFHERSRLFVEAA